MACSRISSTKLAFITALCVSSLTFVSLAEQTWAQSSDVANRSVAGKAKSKKKKAKRLRASVENHGRVDASTLSRSRYFAQNDLESDLDASLESDLDGVNDASNSDSADASVDSAPTATEAVSSLGEDVQIQDIQYDSKKDGGTVVISTTGAATYRTREVPSQNQVVVEIANAKLPSKLKRPFNTKDFKQSIVSINAYQESGSNTARIVLQFRQPRSVDVRQNGKVLTVAATGVASSSPLASTAAPPSAKSEDFQDEEAADAAQLPDENLDGEVSDAATGKIASASEANAGDDEPVERSTPRKSGRILPSSSIEQERLGELQFYGRPISIEVRDTPVRDVITLISDQSGANIVMSDDVTGNITLKLRQVPWDQALSILMKSRGLGYVRQNGVLRVAPIRQLQAEIEEARRILEAQEATLPLKVKVIPVSFANVTLLATQIRSTLQGPSGGGAVGTTAASSRGRIEADPRTSSLIVTDTEEKVKRIEQLVKALDTPPLQVMIEGKIVEAKEGVTRTLGVNWGYTGQDLGIAGGTLSHNVKINPALAAGNTNLDLKLGTLDFLGDLTAKLALFESESVARIISSPRVITMNAQPATISQSVSIPTPNTIISNTGGTPIAGVGYKDIPTVLSVTPQITSSGDVLMKIKFDRAFQAGQTGAEASIDNRSVDTNVMVKNGQTTVIGGIYQSDESEGENGTPLLRKIPVIGWLFKSVTKSTTRNELLVFITPRILNADRTLPKAGVIQ